MDDIHSFHTRTYEKSADIEEQTLQQRFITLAPVIPILIGKLFIVLCALIFELFKQIFYCFVPQPLTNIRGQLAAVSVIPRVFKFHFVFCGVLRCETLTFKFN